MKLKRYKLNEGLFKSIEQKRQKLFKRDLDPATNKDEAYDELMLNFANARKNLMDAVNALSNTYRRCKISPLNDTVKNNCYHFTDAMIDQIKSLEYTILKYQEDILNNKKGYSMTHYSQFIK
jgi:hypothetical protein